MNILVLAKRYSLAVLGLVLVQFLSYGSINFVGENFTPIVMECMEEYGFTPSAYQIIHNWIENSPVGFVWGALLKDKKTDLLIELYFDSEGKLIPEDDFLRYGITPKDWSGSIKELPTVFNEQTKDVDTTNLDRYPWFSKTLPSSTWKKSLHTFELPPYSSLDWAMIEEDSNPEMKGLKKIGLVVDLWDSVVLFGNDKNLIDQVQIVHVDSGFIIRRINLSANNAVGIKLHLRSERPLPPHHALFIKNSGAEGLPEQIHMCSPELWTPTVWGDSVTLFYVSPIETTFPPQNITIDKYAYIFANPIASDAKKASTCYEDLSCYPDWDVISRGIVGIARVYNRVVVYCTGSLINDGDNTKKSRYVLTAYHCINPVTSPNSIEFYWFFRSETCQGNVPDLNSLPKSVGFNYITGSPTDTGADMSLIQLSNTPPENTTELGLSSASVPVNQEVAVIHHPGGTYQRITFGYVTEEGSPSSGFSHVRDLKFYYEVRYTLGSTEAGSSGAPLLRKENPVILGQLWGGYASCDQMKEPDYFGRMSVSFPLIEPYLYSENSYFDVDNSGSIDENDLMEIINVVLGISNRKTADVTRDSFVDACDIQQLYNKLMNL